MDRQPERARARRDRLADPPHPDDPERLAADAVPEHRAGAPAAPFAGARQLSPSPSRRGTDRISAIVMSAVSSVSTPGVLVTRMLARAPP